MPLLFLFSANVFTARRRSKLLANGNIHSGWSLQRRYADPAQY